MVRRAFPLFVCSQLSGMECPVFPIGLDSVSLCALCDVGLDHPGVYSRRALRDACRPVLDTRPIQLVPWHPFPVPFLPSFDSQKTDDE